MVVLALGISSWWILNRLSSDMSVMHLHKILNIVVIQASLTHGLLVSTGSLNFISMFSPHGTQTNNPLAIIPILILT